MLRASSYTIYVDLPGNSDEILLVHGYTGAYDRVSRNVAEYLLSREAGPPKPLHGQWVTEPAARQAEVDVPTPADMTIELLKRRGYLTRMSPDEETGFLARMTKKLQQIAVRREPNYIFMPTYDCNLRCGYCFQNHMRTDSRFRHLLRTIQPEMIDRIMSALPRIEESHGFEHGAKISRRVGFFGGEPLLAVNRPAIEQIMTRTKELGPARFWAVTNATELAAYDTLLGPDGISHVQITMDGPPREHDTRRIYADGSGSFERIAANVDLCLDSGVSVSLRMNIDRNNIAQLPELAETFIERGWDKRPGFSTYTAPITNSESKVTLTELQQKYFNSWELDQAIDEMRELYPVMRVIGRPDDQLVGRVRSIFDQRAGLPELKSAFCGAHTNMYIFDAFGDIYACWERTGDASIRIGRVLENGQVEVNESMTRLWRTRTPASNPTCRKCRYALHCGGGCAVLAEGSTGKFHSNYCDGFAERFRDAVATAYLSFVTGGAVLQQERVCDL